jgi:hypothetical protein
MKSVQTERITVKTRSTCLLIVALFLSAAPPAGAVGKTPPATASRPTGICDRIRPPWWIRLTRPPLALP